MTPRKSKSAGLLVSFWIEEISLKRENSEQVDVTEAGVDGGD